MILIDPILMQSISSLWSLGSFLHKQISTRPKKLVLASACLMSSAMDSCFWCRKNKWKWQTNKQVQDKSNQASSNKTKNSTKWGEVTEVTRSKVHVLELRILLLCCSQFIPGFTADSRQGQRWCQALQHVFVLVLCRKGLSCSISMCASARDSWLASLKE